MNFDLALFLQYTGKADLFEQVDTPVKPYAGEKHLWRWHPYESSRPHACIEHPPDAFITAEGVWHEVDIAQEEPVYRLVRRRQKAFAAIKAEEEQAHDQDTAAARCLVRFALWESERKFPLTPWRQLWRQALLDHATMVVVYLACERSVPIINLESKTGRDK